MRECRGGVRECQVLKRSVRKRGMRGNVLSWLYPSPLGEFPRPVGEVRKIVTFPVVSVQPSMPLDWLDSVNTPGFSTGLSVSLGQNLV